jgi:hypothetical protein
MNRRRGVRDEAQRSGKKNRAVIGGAIYGAFAGDRSS